MRVPATIATGLLALAAALVAPSAAHAESSAYALDCASLPEQGLGETYSSQTFYVLPGETVTFTITGFDYVYDFNANTSVSANPVTDTVVMAPGDDFEFGDDSSACSYTFNAMVEEAGPETVPPGSLLSTNDITIPLNGPQITVADNTNDNEHVLGGDSVCGLSTEINGEHVYGTLPITIVTAGTYAFRGMRSTPAGDYAAGLNPFNPSADPFLAVYSTFDPAAPDEGVIGCNDDQNDLGAEDDAQYLSDGTIIEGHQPYFTAYFTPGTYTLVLMTWEDMSSSDFAAGKSVLNELSFAPGPISTRFELWGVSGGLVAGDSTEPATDPATETAGGTVSALATTGGELGSGVVVMAGVLLMLGTSLLFLRRRFSGRPATAR